MPDVYKRQTYWCSDRSGGYYVTSTEAVVRLILPFVSFIVLECMGGRSLTMYEMCMSCSTRCTSRTVPHVHLGMYDMYMSYNNPY